jgi:mono/diheme cytochrome c family protein
VLFAALLFPIGFAGWAVGHYTSLGKSASVRTVTVSPTTAATSTGQGTTTAATTTAGTTSGKTTTSQSGGNAAAGKAVFTSNSCATCHTFAPANATGAVGPDLDKAPAQDAKAAKMPLAAFIKESITDPDAYIAKGYTKGVMPTTFKSSLSPTQLADLVAFILSGTKS